MHKFHFPLAIPFALLGLFVAVPHMFAAWASHAVVGPELPEGTHAIVKEVVEQYRVTVERASPEKLRVEILIPDQHARQLQQQYEYHHPKRYYLVTTRESLRPEELNLRDEARIFGIWRRAREEQTPVTEELKEVPRFWLQQQSKARQTETSDRTDPVEHWKETRKILELRHLEVSEDGKIVFELPADKAPRSYVLWDFAAIIEHGGLSFDGGLYLTIDIPAYAARLAGLEPDESVE